MKKSRILHASIALALPLVSLAATTQTFDGGGTSGTAVQSGSVPGPIVTAGGPSGSFLRLINDGVGSQNNSYAFDATDTGNWSSITGSYDFRLGSVDGPADGISFMLIPTSQYGSTGAGVTAFTAEEPNVAGAFAIGHDVYQDNAISLHWDGAEQVNVTADAANDINFANNVFNRVTFTLTQVGNGANVTVSVIKDVYGGAPVTYQYINQAINLQPYENRVQFSGRTGGLDMNGDVDNLNVAYSGTAAVLAPAPVTGRLYQDFDTANNTRYVTGSFSGSKNKANFDGPLVQATGGSGGGAFLRLTKDSQLDTLTAVTLDRGQDGGLASGRRVEFDFRMSNPDLQTPADGLGLLLLPTDTFGTHGQGPSLPFEQPNLANALGIGLRVYNGAGGPANRVTLNWNGSEVATTGDLPTSTVDLLNNQWNRTQVDILPADGGANVSVRIIQDVNGVATTVPLITSQFVSGLLAYDFRPMIGGRTGGLTVTADVDRITSQPLRTGSPGASTTQFFDEVGTGYRTSDFNASPTLHPTIIDGGVTGKAIRLIHADNGQEATLGFERSVPSGPKPSVTAEFDFRMNADTDTIQRADGFQMALLGVSTYGEEGPIESLAHNFENLLLPNALSLCIRIYDGNIATPEDFIRIGYNGVEANATTFSQANFGANWFDLNSDQFHHLKLELVDNGTDALATLTLTPDGVGTPVTVFSNLLIAGLDLDIFDFRLGFGARTGGLNTALDLDNISLVATPEPVSGMLLSTGLFACFSRRRRMQR